MDFLTQESEKITNEIKVSDTSNTLTLKEDSKISLPNLSVSIEPRSGKKIKSNTPREVSK